MKKLFALLAFCGISMATMADGEYPNAMVVHLTNGTEKIYFLQDTRLSFKFDGFNWQLTINDSESLTENDIENIAYEYRISDGTGIKDMLNTGSTVEVYSIDGRKVGFSEKSVQEALKRLPRGTYIIQSNGKTSKIVK